MSAPHVLREYALIADGERGALVGPRGDVCWMCAPRWHSEPVFATLLGGPGEFTVTPVARFVWGGRYEPDSLVWRGRWVTDEGVVECRDALAAPADRDRAVILRRITAEGAPARLRVILDATGSWGDRVALHGAPADGEITVAPGARRDLVLEVGDRPPGAPAPDADALWEATEAWWRSRVPVLPEVVGERDARLACAVLRGLTSVDGGMVAAATMGLPERAEQGRNYDYRYAWIRDQCYAGIAAAAAGVDDLLDSATGFVSARLLEDGPRLRPAYTVDGGPVPDERELPWPGYPGGRAIAGNQAGAQFQLDAFGEALLLFAAAAGRGRLGDDGRRALEAAASAIAARRGDPDAGIWEIEPRHWTHSRLVCAAGLEAAARAAPRAAARGGWPDLARVLIEEASREALHPAGRWQRAPGDPRVDASLLLPSVRGALAAGDPRSAATLAAVRADLEQDGHVYRFRPDGRPLGEAEGAFLLCGLTTALAEAAAGDRTTALRRFERVRGSCGPPGLLSEEWDVGQRQMRGNLPQAFVHALLLECAVRLAAPGPAPVSP